MAKRPKRNFPNPSPPIVDSKATANVVSPKATGDAGGHFESRVAAYYLSSLLVEGVVRGLDNAVAKEVNLQRRYEEQLLDDVIVKGAYPTGPAVLSLQVKRQLSFTSKNALFQEVLGQCWQTFTNQGFQRDRDSFGVALSVYSSKVDDHYQTVLSWARHSVTAQDFFNRIQQPGLSSESSRTFVSAIKDGVKEICGHNPTEDDIWLFLKHFVILHFDFEQEERSRDYHHVLERLAFALRPEDREKSEALWRALVDEADRAKPTAGSVDQATLRSQLGKKFQLEALPNCFADLARITAESQRALADIGTFLGDIALNRDESFQKIDKALQDSQLIEIVGGPGTGKSAILRMLAERQGLKGPVLFLKHDRLSEGPGWAGQAQLWKLENDLDRLLSELAIIGEPVLFVDGIDRIRNHAQWTVINDVFRAIFKAGESPKWRMIVSARGNTLEYIQRLDPEVLNRLSRQRITIPSLTDAELDIVARAHPSLAPLLQRHKRTKGLAKSPYLLKRLIRWLDTRPTDNKTPATAVDLMRLWWTTADEPDTALIGKRQELLLELVERQLKTPGRPVPTRGLDDDALNSLESDETLRLDHVQRTVTFSHDILEDWALCILLNQQRDELPSLLQQLGEPLWLVEAVQLMATWVLEEDEDAFRWSTLRRQIEEAGLQPRWRRAILTAPLQSTRATELLKRLEAMLLDEEGRLLKDLLVTVRTVETFPNTNALDPKILPRLSDSDRVEMAYYLAFPRGESWVPLLDWLVPRLQTLPPKLVWEVSLIMEMWQQGLANHRTRFSRAFISFSLEWLHLLEQDHFDRDEDVQKRIGALGLDWDDEKKLERRFRAIIISSPNDAPDLISSYLSEIGGYEARPDAKEQILKNTKALTQFLPTELVDFMLEVMRVFPRKDDPYETYSRSLMDFKELGIDDDDVYYPASHLQGSFLTLLRFHPDEGIRLIDGLCNHAMSTWRRLSQQKDQVTPLPVRIRFPWSEREFWGWFREYTWFRGQGPGPYTIMSALMALELWMEERVAAGDDVEVLFQKVLQGNDCVGALGACVSIALANPQKSLRAALPLVTCPFLWLWDIRRFVSDRGSQANTIADWTRFGHLLQPVRDRNNLPHRRYEIRNLVPLYMFSKDEELRNALIEGVQAFPNNLPFECVEQREHEESVHELRERMEYFATRVDTTNWERQPDQERGGFLLTFKPPADFAVKNQGIAKTQEEHTRYMSLGMWADKAFEEDTPPGNLTIAEALKEARELDEPNLFAIAQDPENFDALQPGAVSGVAAVAVRFSEDLDNDIVEWCRDVFHRAARTSEKDDPLLSRSTYLMFHPVRNAARGLAALLAKGQATDKDKELLLALIGHPLEQVMESAFVELRYAWSVDPFFCWQAFLMGIRITVKPKKLVPYHDRPTYDETELQWMEAQFSQTWEEYLAGIQGDLPIVPMPWLPASEGQGRDGYTKSDTLFMWDLAPKVLFPVPLEQLIGNHKAREPFLNLVGNLVQWTIQESFPPWAKYRRDTTEPFAWTSHFFEWCGGLSAHITLEEVKRLVIEPIRVTEQELGLRFTSHFMYGVIKSRFPQHQLPNEATLELWRELCEWVLSHSEWNRVKNRDFLGNEFEECVGLAIFIRYGFSLLDPPWPGLDQVLDLIEQWIEKFGAHPATFFKLVEFLNYTAWELSPEPALTWLEGILNKTKGNKDFFDKNNNGRGAAKFLHRAWTEKREAIVKALTSLERLSRMVDLLVDQGERLAAQTQQEIVAYQKNRKSN